MSPEGAGPKTRPSRAQKNYTKGVAAWLDMERDRLPDGPLKEKWPQVRELVGKHWLLGDGPVEDGGEFISWTSVARAYGVPLHRCTTWTWLFRSHGRLPLGLRKEHCVFLVPKDDPEVYEEMKELLQLALGVESAATLTRSKL